MKIEGFNAFVMLISGMELNTNERSGLNSEQDVDDTRTVKKEEDERKSRNDEHASERYTNALLENIAILKQQCEHLKQQLDDEKRKSEMLLNLAIQREQHQMMIESVEQKQERVHKRGWIARLLQSR